jgi:hypothetical protein
MTVEEALEKGYLQQGKIKLMPVIKGGKMINDPAHVGFFMFDGASVQLCLPTDARGVLVNPFKSEEEKKFFEEALDVDLNLHKKKDNFWHNFYVKIIKDAAFMEFGIEFNLIDPLDNLRVRVLKLQPIVADDISKKDDRPEYKFAMVPEDYKDRAVLDEMDSQQKIWTYWGSIKDSSKKMVDFLTLYLMTKKTGKEVPADATVEFLASEISKIINEDKKGFLEVITDPDSSIKLFIGKALRIGAIQKSGVNSYMFPGAEVRYTLKELVEELTEMKKMTDDTYLKIKAQIDRYEDRRAGKTEPVEVMEGTDESEESAVKKGRPKKQ